MRPVVLAVALLAGCSKILGIGALPEPAGDDAAVPMDAACPAGMMLCGTACFDLTQTLAHCGTCDNACPMLPGATSTCEAATCKLDTDEAIHKAWGLTAPTPWLAFWKDGTLLASSGAATALLSTGATPASTPFTALAGRPSIAIPSDPLGTSVAISHYGFFEGRTQADVQLWTNSIHGCCGSGPDGFAVDPVLNRMFTGHGVTEIATDTGATVLATSTFDQHGSPFFVTPMALYLPRVGTAQVQKYDRAHNLQWTATIGTTAGVTVGGSALASDGGIVVATTAGDKLTRLSPTSAKTWEIDVVSPGSPITTSTGLVVVGAMVSGVPNLCAFDFASGAERWCTPTDASVVDVLAGDDGVLYTTVASTPTVYGYDRATGVLRYTFRNVPAPEEMLLRDHRLYISGAGSVTAIDVPAAHYDSSSWPVRFHDNQRTRGTVSTLDF